MKRFAFLSIMMLSVMTFLSGCGGSLVRSAYDGLATPEASAVCNKSLKGKSVEEAEKQLNMGKADAVRLNENEQETRIYSKGALSVEITIVEDKVLKYNCNPIKK